MMRSGHLKQSTHLPDEPEKIPQGQNAAADKWVESHPG